MTAITHPHAHPSHANPLHLQQIQRVVGETGVELTLRLLEINGYALWVRMLECEGCEAVSHKALELVKQYPHLRRAKDRKGRLAVEELAPKAMNDMISALFCWHGR